MIHRLQAFCYGGSKTFLLDWIYKHFPHGWRSMHWVDVFGGSGVVTCSKEIQRYETMNDISAYVYDTWDILKRRGKKLLRLLKATPYSKRIYQEAVTYIKKDMAGEIKPKKLLRAYNTIIVLNQGMSKRLPGDAGGWQKTIEGGGGAKPQGWVNRVNRLKNVSKRLQNIQLEQDSAIEIIERYNNRNVLIYADPPYYGDRTKGMYGKYEMSEEDHIRLAEVLSNHKGNVMLAGINADNHPYDRILTNWNKVVKTNLLNKTRRNYQEVMWLNYQYEPTLFDDPGGI